MKLSSRKQLLSEADAELRRMQKLAGLNESKTSLNELYDNDLYAVVRDVGEEINREFSAITKDFAKKMSAKYSSKIENMMKQFIGKPLPKELIDVLHIKPREKRDAMKENLKVKSVRVYVYGVRHFTIALQIYYEGGETRIFALWNSRNVGDTIF